MLLMSFKKIRHDAKSNADINKVTSAFTQPKTLFKNTNELIDYLEYEKEKRADKIKKLQEIIDIENEMNNCIDNLIEMSKKEKSMFLIDYTLHKEGGTV